MKTIRFFFGTCSVAVFVITLIAGTAVSQNIQVQVDYTDKNTGIVSAAQMEDGGFLVLSFVESGSAPVYTLLQKFNTGGDSVWTRIYNLQGRFKPDCYPQKIISEPEGSFYLILKDGYSNGKKYLYRLDKEGKELWKHQLDISKDFQVHDIEITSEGNAMLLIRNKIEDWYSRFEIVKYNKKGETYFQQSFDDIDGDGYKENLDVQDLLQTDDGGLLICGTIMDKNSDSTPYIYKMNSGYEKMWVKKIESPGYIKGKIVKAVKANSRNYLLFGQLYAVNSNYDLIFIIMDNSGNVINTVPVPVGTSESAVNLIHWKYKYFACIYTQMANATQIARFGIMNTDLQFSAETNLGQQGYFISITDSFYTKDGSLAFCGDATSVQTQKQSGFFMVTDSLNKMHEQNVAK